MAANNSRVLAVLASSLLGCGSDTETHEQPLIVCVDKTRSQAAVQQYYEKSRVEAEVLPPDWPAWVNDNYDRFCRAFDLTEYNSQVKQKTVSVVVFYYNNVPIPYKNPWPSEEEHMEDLEKLLELTFPSWNFVVDFGGEESLEKIQAYDTSVYLNAGINLGGAGSIFLDREGALQHEMAHELGLEHHYDVIENYGKGMNMAPGETRCLMDISSNQLGSPDRFATDISMHIDNGAKIKGLKKEINARYPDEY